jgi:hypothetical protein
MAEKQSLTANDRCDRCGAQAYVGVLLPESMGGGELMFCAHHWRDHGEKIEAIEGVMIVNEVHVLQALEEQPVAL